MLLLLRMISIIINTAYLAAESLPSMWQTLLCSLLPPQPHLHTQKLEEAEKAIAGNSIIILKQIKSTGVNKASLQFDYHCSPKLKL